MSKESRQARGREKQKKRRGWGRNFLIFLIPLCLLGVLTYNSLNVYKNVAGQMMIEPNGVIGYQVEEMQYTVQPDTEHYLSFPLAEGSARAFSLYFNGTVTNDVEESGGYTPVTARIISEGNTIQTIQTSITPTDTYLSLVFGNVAADTLEISVDGNFNYNSGVQEVLYVNEDSSQSKLLLTVIVIFVLLLLAAVYISSLPMTDRFIERILNAFRDGLKEVQGNPKRILIWCGQLLAGGVSGNIIWYLIYRGIDCAGRGSRWDMNDILFGSMLGAVIFLLFRYAFYKTMSFERLFLSCGIVIGTVLAVLLPLHLNVSWDDQIHYQSATVLSHAGKSISLSEHDYYMSCFSPQLKGYGENDRQEMWRVLNDKDSNRTISVADVVISWKLIVYLPIALVLFIARGLCLPLSICIILGRAASAWFFFYIIYRGMRHLKSGKLVMAAASFVPISMFLASNYNYDYWLVGLISYSMAYMIGEYQRPDKPLTVKDLVLIFGGFVVGGAAKPVYIPMLALTAFFPKGKFKSKRFRKGYHACFIALIVCAALGFAFLVFGGGLGEGDLRGGNEVSAPQQIQFILANPLQYTQILLRFLKDYLSLKNIQLDLVDTAYILRKDWLGLPVFLWLIIVSFLDRDKEENRQIPWYMKVAAVPLAFISACMVATSMYVVFTAVGADTVSGCQGRYLLPLLCPLLLALSRIRFLVIPWRGKAKHWVEAAAFGVSMFFAGIMMSVFLIGH